ncbi:MAG: biotin--[acetyl-CoA-carboxylase] ligase [Gammaproteobacteria bacterium]|nr:biotin--[acetyl-CoA-carboxylase] ligase [Gammaproteobacteria bacterium]
MSPLSEMLIRQHLQKIGFQKPLNTHILSNVDSTNRYLKDLPRSAALDICCAETQTQGRGRFQREWFSPTGENIYCSLRYFLGPDISTLSALSLLISIAMMRTLENFDVAKGIGIKWPNDLWRQGKKLSGILIESTPTREGYFAVVIGIGLNINSDLSKTHTQNKPWCSLYDITGQTFDRNAIIAQMIAQIDQHIQQFMHVGFEPFLKQWKQWDLLEGNAIEVLQAGVCVRGIASGVTINGELMVIDEHQKTKVLNCGETSIVATCART